MYSGEEILGNEILKKQLKAAVYNNRIQHAYLFCGEKGIGMEALINQFVLDIFCKTPDEKSACGKCSSCKKILSDNHPDVVYLRHEKESIGVDIIRDQLSDSIYIKPYEGGHKIFIIEDAEKMTVQAQNALLKTLEEPPEYAVIILSCSEISNILETIISRSVVLRVSPVNDAEISDYLVNSLNADTDKAKICAAFSRGNIGRAKALLNSAEFDNCYKKVIKLCRTVKKMDVIEIHEEIRGFLNDDYDLNEILDMIELWYRDIYVYKATKSLSSLKYQGEKNAIMNETALLTEEGIKKITDDIEKCRIRLNNNVNAELALELLFLSMKEN